MIANLGGSVTFRGDTIMLYTPSADQHHPAVGGRVGRLEIDDIVCMVTIHVLDRATPVDLADVCFLRHDPTLRSEFVLVRIEVHLHHLGMRNRQQFAKFCFHYTVVTLAEEFHSDGTLGVNKITRRPAFDSIRLPQRAILVGQNRPGKKESLRCGAYVVHIEPDIELAIVHSNDIEAVRMVLAIPVFDNGEVADAIDASVFPEVDEDDMTTVLGDMMRHGGALIEPRYASA